MRRLICGEAAVSCDVPPLLSSLIMTAGGGSLAGSSATTMLAVETRTSAGELGSNGDSSVNGSLINFFLKNFRIF